MGCKGISTRQVITGSTMAGLLYALLDIFFPKKLLKKRSFQNSFFGNGNRQLLHSVTPHSLSFF